MARPRKLPKNAIALHLQIERADCDRLRELAKNLGFIIPSGTNAGQGSISALVGAIATEKIKLQQIENNV
jgi:hypothetical protein